MLQGALALSNLTSLAVTLRRAGPDRAKREHRARQQLQQLARVRGWTYHPLPGALLGQPCAAVKRGRWTLEWQEGPAGHRLTLTLPAQGDSGEASLKARQDTQEDANSGTTQGDTPGSESPVRSVTAGHRTWDVRGDDAAVTSLISSAALHLQLARLAVHSSGGPTSASCAHGLVTVQLYPHWSTRAGDQERLIDWMVTTAQLLSALLRAR